MPATKEDEERLRQMQEFLTPAEGSEGEKELEKFLEKELAAYEASRRSSPSLASAVLASGPSRGVSSGPAGPGQAKDQVKDQAKDAFKKAMYRAAELMFGFPPGSLQALEQLNGKEKFPGLDAFFKKFGGIFDKFCAANSGRFAGLANLPGSSAGASPAARQPEASSCSSAVASPFATPRLVPQGAKA